MATKTASPVSTRFPHALRLPGGASLTLRLMGAADRDDVLEFARALSPQDTLFLRMDISDPLVVDEWIKNIAAGRTTTVLAYDGKTLAGFASLHHNEVRWTRHIGEIRTIVGSGYRNMRLGVRLVQEIFAVAKEIGLQKITANMTVEQAGARAAFERIGFRPEAVLCDYVIDGEGRTHDMLIMSYDIEGFNDD